MLSRTIIVKAVTTIEGQEWGVDVPIEINAAGLNDFRLGVHKSLKGLLKAGFRPRRPPLDSPPANQNPQPMPEVSAIYAPQCPNCRREMKQSNVQRKGPDTVSFFCPGKVASGYCNWRGEIHQETGEVKTWEVSK